MSDDAKEEEPKAPKGMAGPITDEDKNKLADTNMENYGSQEHRDLKKNAAKKEKAWKGAGLKPGLQVWRIEKFKVKHWPKQRYGEFYSGDSYIILNTMKDKDSGAFSYDVYFWLGSETTQDEAGTAAYKTVELDDLLGDEPVQYREVQENESQPFLDLWDKMHVLDGGVESGFNKVKPKEYKPRLLHVTGYKTHVQIFQVKLEAASLNNHDSFVLDKGLLIYQFNGCKASAWEKRKANFEVHDIKNSRHGKVKEVHIVDGLEEDCKESDDFWNDLGGKPDELADYEEQKPDTPNHKTTNKLKMLKISDESGKMEVQTICDGNVDMDKLESDDAFICDFGISLYVWIGKGANKAEKREAMVHATKYLMMNSRSSKIPICRVQEGKEPVHFIKLMKAGKQHGWTADMMEGGFAGRKSAIMVQKDMPDDVVGAKLEDNEDDGDDVMDDAQVEANKKAVEEEAAAEE